MSHQDEKMFVLSLQEIEAVSGAKPNDPQPQPQPTNSSQSTNCGNHSNFSVICLAAGNLGNEAGNNDLR